MKERPVDLERAVLAHNQAPVIPQPANGALHDPAAAIAPQGAAILPRRTNAILFVRADQFAAAPLRRIHRIPSRTRRLSIHGRPPLRCLGGLGSKGAIFFHCASVSNGPDRAIRPPSALLTPLIAHFPKLNYSHFRCLYQVVQQLLENLPSNSYAQGLRGGEAGKEEAEEGVWVGVEADLRVGRIWGVRGTRVGPSETFVVNADVHGLDGAEGRIDEEGNGHGVEKRGRLLAPLVIKEREGVGQRGCLAEEEGALDLVELELGGVEGHDEEGHTRGEEFLGGGNVIEDVPLRLRWRGRAEAKVAIAALDGAAHHD